MLFRSFLAAGVVNMSGCKPPWCLSANACMSSRSTSDAFRFSAKQALWSALRSSLSTRIRRPTSLLDIEKQYRMDTRLCIQKTIAYRIWNKFLRWGLLNDFPVFSIAPPDVLQKWARPVPAVSGLAECGPLPMIHPGEPAPRFQHLKVFRFCASPGRASALVLL